MAETKRKKSGKRKKLRKKTASVQECSLAKVASSKTRVQASKHKKAAKDTFAAIKKSLLDISNSFAQGADKVAELLLEDSQKSKGPKAKRLKQELVSMIKNVASGVKKSLKNVKPKDVLHEASYEMGKLSRITRDACAGIFNDLME